MTKVMQGSVVQAANRINWVTPGSNDVHNSDDNSDGDGYDDDDDDDDDDEYGDDEGDAGEHGVGR